VGIDQLFSLVNLGFFCLGLSITFLLIFLLRKTEWWALLPSGALAGICAWIMLAILQPAIGFHPPALIFLVGLSFIAIYLFSVQRHKMRFALFTGLLIVTAALLYYFIVIFHEFTLFWAILLVAAGITFPFAVIFFEKRTKRYVFFGKPRP
jgi:hypothetical protein